MTNRPLRVFLCHSSADKPAVRELYKKLRAEAENWIDPWLDKMKILPGQNWRIVIEEAVEASDIVIICLSNHSVNKEGFVQREIRYAYDLALEKPDGVIFLIPLRLEECEVPRGMRSFQWVDYFGVEKEEQYSNLLEAMKLRHKQKISLEKPPAQPVGRVSNPTETVAPKQSQAESLTYDAGLLKNTEEINKYASLIDSVSISSEELKRQYDQLEAIAIEQGALYKKDNKTPDKLILSNGMDFMRVPAGKFLMGSTKENKSASEDEHPQHTVDIPYDYWMARYPVTNELYNAYTKAKNIKHPVDDWGKKEDHPVTCVKWIDAMAYCQWLNETLQSEFKIQNLQLRLPSEAEWEKAARGTDGLEYPWGYTFYRGKCNTAEGGKGGTTPVGFYSPQGDSPYGCADMSGNVWEWTHSLKKAYPYNYKDGREDEKVSGYRVSRGGNFFNSENAARCAFRYGYGFNSPSFLSFLNSNSPVFSFRVAVAPPIFS
jgi:formylglycine-generating enzyme required for sulfatase activity